MQFTLGQLRDTIGLSVETFRHWKRVLPPFMNRKGHSPCFTIGDLLAASVLHRLTEECGVRIGHLSALSQEVVRCCNGASWAALEGKLLIIHLSSGTCHIAHSCANVQANDLMVVCPFDALMTRLRDALLRSQPPADQGNLRFPPTPVVRATPTGRRRA